VVHLTVQLLGEPFDLVRDVIRVANRDDVLDRVSNRQAACAVIVDSDGSILGCHDLSTLFVDDELQGDGNCLAVHTGGLCPCLVAGMYVAVLYAYKIGSAVQLKTAVFMVVCDD